MESISDVIMAAKGHWVTVSLSSGKEFFGVLENMTYFNKGEKGKERPRILVIKTGTKGYGERPEHFYYIDAIKVDAIDCYEDLSCTAESAKKK